eukprot:4505937-Amphidinium_carterae.1
MLRIQGEFHNTALADGHVVFFNLPSADANRLKTQPFQDYMVIDGPVKIPFTLSSSPSDFQTHCQSYVAGTSLLLPPHILYHVHHLHNDLIMKVAYLLYHFKLEPKKTTLYLLNGGRPNNYE